MGYHPETLAFSFPPYPRNGTSRLTRKNGTREERRWSFSALLYELKPWIGFDIWHIDPERFSEDQRTDDSCGWFDRRPGPYAEAVKEMLGDAATMHDIRLSLGRRVHVPSPYYPGISDPDHINSGYPRLPLGESLALTLMIATQLERARWWKKCYPAPWWQKPFIRERNVMRVAVSLALEPTDNLSSVQTPESMVRLIAGALHRQLKPRWKHPRWHVHHWRVNFDLVRNTRRMFERCTGCGNRLGFGHCPVDSGGKLYHSSGCRNSPFGVTAE